MSTTATTLTIVEQAFLSAEIADSLTDLGLAVSSVTASTYAGIGVQVGDEDGVDRAATEFELEHDTGAAPGLYSREGTVRGTRLRVFSGRKLRRVHSCPACDHSGPVSA